MVTSVEKVIKQCRMMPNWKDSGKYGVQGYWIKNLSNLREQIAVQINNIKIRNDILPAWIAHGRAVFCQRGPRKGNAVEDYCPITFLPPMWKLVTGVKPEKIILYKRNACQKNKKNAEEEAVEQRVNYLLIRLC